MALPLFISKLSPERSKCIVDILTSNSPPLNVQIVASNHVEKGEDSGVKCYLGRNIDYKLYMTLLYQASSRV